MKSKDDTVVRRARTLPSSPATAALHTTMRTYPAPTPLDDASVRSHSSNRSATSLSSTLTADGQPKKRQLLKKSQSCAPLNPQSLAPCYGNTSSLKKQQRTNKQRLRVRFNESLNKRYRSNVCIDEVCYLWYQEEDYVDFHESMAAAVSSITIVPDAEEESSCARMLGRLLEVCTQQVETEQRTSPILSRDEKRTLRSAFKKTPDLVGLERNVSGIVTKDRIERRDALVERLEDLQSCGWPNAEVEALRLCQASMEMSYASRLFARYVALGVAPSASLSWSLSPKHNGNSRPKLSKLKSASCLSSSSHHHHRHARSHKNLYVNIHDE